MIERLKGTIVYRKNNGVIVDVQGVGYSVEVPLSTLCQLGVAGTAVEVWTYTHVREDALRLYGFLTYSEKELFEILLSVSGIGPKLGLAILSTLDATAIRIAVSQGLIEVFQSVPGIGARMAEKILVELKAKLKRLNEVSINETGTTLDGARKSKEVSLELIHVCADVQSALENLGFKTQLVSTVLREVTMTVKEADFNLILRKALLNLKGDVVADTQVVPSGEELKAIF